MKAAAVILKKPGCALTAYDLEPLHALGRRGYSFGRVYALDETDATFFVETIRASLLSKAVVVVADESLHAQLKEALSVFADAEFPEEGTYLKAKEREFFLLSPGPAGSGQVLSESALLAPEGTANIVFRCVGAPEEAYAAAREKCLALCPGTDFRFTEEDGDGRLEIRWGEESGTGAIESGERAAAEALSDWLYSVDDTPLEKRVLELLKMRGHVLCTGESFTGGGVAGRIVSVPGASDALYEGICAYSNDAKEKRLSVSAETLKKYGAVSDETAYEMAAGLLGQGHCTVSLSTTGIAGPGADGTDKPVGLCYMAVGTAESVYVYKYRFGGTREEITARAVNEALFLLYRHIK